METYQINFRFRMRWVPGLVHDYGTHCLVYTSDHEVLKHFTGCFEFTLPGKKYVAGHQHNKDATDLKDLVMGISAQLH